MSDKKLVCKADGRQFKTAAALAQHRRDAHAAGQKPQRVARAARRANGPMQAAVNTAALISVPQMVRGAASDIARMSGVDRIFHGDLAAAGISHGQKAVDILVVPASFVRLASVARAFQRIRYTKLRFRMEPQVPTSIAGGYVMGFVRDPVDEVDNLNQLTSQQGSVTTKWWQSSVVDATPPNRLYYTSEGAEIREFSPGKLVVMVDGPPTQAGSYTVFCEWSVELSGAALENTKQMDPEFVVAKGGIWTQDGHVGLFTKQGDVFLGTPATIIPGCAAGDVFRLPTPITMVQANGNTRICHWLYVKTAGDLYPAFNSPTDTDMEQYKATNLVVVGGSRLDLENAAPRLLSGECEAPSSSDSLTMTAASAQPSSHLERLCGLLETMLSKKCDERMSASSSYEKL